jgi:hypothetical protein
MEAKEYIDVMLLDSNMSTKDKVSQLDEFDRIMVEHMLIPMHSSELIEKQSIRDYIKDKKLELNND